jgi:hypothetical protein
MARNGEWLGEKHERRGCHCQPNQQEKRLVLALKRRPPCPGPFSVRYKVQSKRVEE